MAFDAPFFGAFFIMKNSTKKIVLTAMFVALSYVLAYFIHFPVIPAAPFLKYDPKDVIITLGGFMLGPIPCLIISVLTPLLELLTRNGSGIIGFTMNVFAAVSFTLPATLIYRKVKGFKGALIGLVVSTLVMTAVMLLWNYILTPLYTDNSRSDVLKLFLPALIPFNILKGVINSAFVLILFKPLQRVFKTENV